jgi:RNA polymerase sigma-70 factor, ECF subfamily
LNTTSHSLIDRIRAGPEGLAWQRWHAIYEPLIRGWLTRNQLVPDDRDDVVQNVLAVVVRRIGEFHHNGRVGAFRNWLKTISIHCLRDHWKKHARDADRVRADQVLDHWADPASELSHVWDLEHDRHLIRKLLAILRPEFNEITWQAFHRHVIDGEEPAVVATRLGITPNAVYIAKSRIMTRLRHEATGLIDDPDAAA